MDLKTITLSTTLVLVLVARTTGTKIFIMGNHAIVSGTDALYETELKQGKIIKNFSGILFSDDLTMVLFNLMIKNRPPNRTAK